jgi:hypothetical protein
MPRTRPRNSLRALSYIASFLACLGLGLITGPALAQDDTCSLAAPPRDAVVGTGLHDSPVYLYPGEIGPAYSGCQTLWYPERPVLRLRFANGVATDLYGYEGGREQVLCSYRDGKVIVDNDKACAETYQRLGQGLKIFGDFPG